MSRPRTLVAALSLFLLACSDAPVGPSPDPQFAKGGGATTLRVDFSLPDAGTDLTGDAKGLYRDGVCGVWGSWADIVYLAPAGSSVPRDQKAACSGIAPRTMSLTLRSRHVSDDPHVDVTESPLTGGVFGVDNVKFGRLDAGDPTATGVVNVPGMCFLTDARGRTSWVGLRFNASNYAGSDDLGKAAVPGGWRFTSRPFPDNLAHCGEGSSAALWHVDLDVTVLVKG